MNARWWAGMAVSALLIVAARPRALRNSFGAHR